MNEVWLINSFVKEKIGLCSLDRRFCGLTHSTIADMVPLARRYQSLHYTLFLFLQTGSAVLDLQVALGAVFQCGRSSVEEVCDDSNVWSDFDVRGVVTGIESATMFHNSVESIQNFFLAWSDPLQSQKQNITKVICYKVEYHIHVNIICTFNIEIFFFKF